MSQSHEVTFDQALIERYDANGPRYTSYPTAVQFSESFGQEEHKRYAAQVDQSSSRISLYVHLPFCNTVCYFCGCNKIVTKRRERAAPYLDRLYKEIEMQSALLPSRPLVEQLHWGGGTPTFQSDAQLRELMAKLRQNFNMIDDDSGEYSIELDPREVTDDTLNTLREIGFNRLSLGVQDVNPKVQAAVNRLQSDEITARAIDGARRENFRSISIDLIYGLPHQTARSFELTLDRVIEFSPDRLSMYNYAHMPELFKPQRRINTEDLPSPQEKLEIMKLAIEKLTSSGYVYIGMDHFAKYDDELAVAQREGGLYRNFQGYSTHSHCDMMALGISAISMLGDSFSQNVKTEDEYFEQIDAGKLPVYRGYALSDDDRLRRAVITGLICHFQLTLSEIEQEFGINFWQYFANERLVLEGMAKDGLLQLDEAEIRVSPRGKLLIRNICMVFDAYLKQHISEDRFSKTI